MTDTLASSAELERMLGADRLARPALPLASDGTAGRRDPSPTWDPWYCLPLNRRRRLIRYMAPAGERGLALDELADLIGAGTLDEALTRWARACELARQDLAGDDVDAWAAADAQAAADAEL